MPHSIVMVNDYVGLLDGAHSDATTSITVRDDTGAPGITSGFYTYMTLDDLAGNREIVKATAKAGKVYTVVRAQEGTTALAWADGAVFSNRLTAQGLEDVTDQVARSPIVLAQAAMPTLTNDSESELIITPIAADTITLPTTGVKQGRKFTIYNRASTRGYNILIEASGGGDITYATPTNHVTVMALQDTPTDAAHWLVVGYGFPPSFRSSKNTSQSILDTTITQVEFKAIEWDLAGWYDEVTNYRFTPKIAGNWLLTSYLRYAGTMTLATEIRVGLRKNGGSPYESYISAVASTWQVNTSVAISFNGIADYVDVITWHDEGSAENISSSRQYSHFSAVYQGLG